MNDVTATIRLHFVDRNTHVVAPASMIVFVFVINLAIFAMINSGESGYTTAVLALPFYMVVLGAVCLTRYLPLALTLGIPRRRFYVGTVAVSAILAAGGAALITVANLIEQGTAGWGVSMHFFRVPTLFDGPPYQVFLSGLVLMVLGFVLGIWIGLIHRAWGIAGVITSFGVLGVLLLGLAWLITVTGGWSAVGAFASAQSAATITVTCAVLAVILAAAGDPAIRRSTV